MKTWAHLHLPRLQAYRNGTGTSEVISVKTGRAPITYASALVLTNCEFKVSLTGRHRCITDNVRNVHAWVVGDRQEITSDDYEEPMHQAVYDPWKGETFVDVDLLDPVYNASRIVMIGENTYYLP